MRTKFSIKNLVLALLLLLVPGAAFGQIGISVSFGPPALPVYEQPICPGDGYLWTPGYWAYDNDDGYYWVPGTWVEAPEVGYLWTPGYWGWGGSSFLFHEGYWGPRVGFYGGIAYGFGYFGVGFGGGRWDGGHFFYNRAVSNINITNIHNTYNTTIINNTNRVSYNGGEGGIAARATAEDMAVEHERHVGPVESQVRHVQMARSNPELRASTNHGRPAIAATSRPGDFHQGAVAAREAGAPYRAPANRPAEEARPAGNARPEEARPAAHAEEARPAAHAEESQPAARAHASELPKHEAPAPVSSGNARADEKYQQQQTKLVAKQNQQHEQLQQKQERDHQQAEQRSVNTEQKQQMEQKHQQQTQQMEQRHTQQQQKLQQRQPSHNEGKPR